MVFNIIIPTYERYDFLSEQLDRLLYCYHKSDRSIELKIHIFDNASPSISSFDYEKYESFNNVSILKRPENIGFQRNVIDAINFLAVENFNDLVWILSDDDIIDTFGFMHLLNYLTNEKKGKQLLLLPWFTSGIGVSNSIRGILSKEEGISNLDMLNIITANALISSWIYPLVDIKQAISENLETIKANSFFQIIINGAVFQKVKKVSNFKRCIGFEQPNTSWRFDVIPTFISDRATAVVVCGELLGIDTKDIYTINFNTSLFIIQRIKLSFLKEGRIEINRLVEALKKQVLFQDEIKKQVLILRIFQYIPLSILRIYFKEEIRQTYIAESNRHNLKLLVFENK
jgi:hypothetical protein